MKILLAGSGGREHAIAWKLAQSPKVSQIICVPGNGGILGEKKCKIVEPSNFEELKNLSFEQAFLKIALKEKVDLAVIGPEDPLANGISDLLLKNKIAVVGPVKNGAQLESSKDFAKKFMKKYGVACAQSETFSDSNSALDFIRKKGAPIVVKADGLAAGKGVVVAKTILEAENAVHELLENFGSAAKSLVIEEYLCGTELSILAAVNVTQKSAQNKKACILPFKCARDHKRLLNGANGPNTGGMGAVCSPSDVSEQTLSLFYDRILLPTLNGLIAEKIDYRGFIFFGLMITKDGPKCLEYNVRLGDPETQAVLPMADFDFAELCLAITNEDGALKDFEPQLKWKTGFQVAPVAVSHGYPGKYQKGKKISLPKNSELEELNAKIFFAGVTSKDESIFTNGGRVLACSAYGETFQKAHSAAYDALQKINFDGIEFRTDIGLPGAAQSN